MLGASMRRCMSFRPCASRWWGGLVSHSSSGRAFRPTVERLGVDALAADPAQQPDVVGRVEEFGAQRAAQDGKPVCQQVVAQGAEQLVVAAAGERAGDQPLDDGRGARSRRRAEREVHRGLRVDARRVEHRAGRVGLARSAS